MKIILKTLIIPENRKDIYLIFSFLTLAAKGKS